MNNISQHNPKIGRPASIGNGLALSRALGSARPQPCFGGGGEMRPLDSSNERKMKRS